MRNTFWFEDAFHIFENESPPEYQLLAAILSRALDDITTLRQALKPDAEEIKWATNAAVWLGIVPASKDYAPIVSFEMCCDFLNIDPRIIRNRINAYEICKVKSFRR